MRKIFNWVLGPDFPAFGIFIYLSLCFLISSVLCSFIPNDPSPIVKPSPMAEMAARYAWIQAPGAGESGAIFQTRTTDGKLVTFVWTCSHLWLDYPGTTDALGNTVPPSPASIKIVVEIRGKKYPAKLVALGSDTDGGTDCALLVLATNPPNVKSVQFITGTPRVGSRLAYIGGALGFHTPPEFFVGDISALNRRTEIGYADIMQCPGEPGCSGSAIYDADGNCEGLMQAMDLGNSCLSLEVPSRRIIKWAWVSKVAWALDPTLAAPAVIPPYK